MPDGVWYSSENDEIYSERREVVALCKDQPRGQRDAPFSGGSCVKKHVESPESGEVEAVCAEFARTAGNDKIRQGILV